MAVHTFVFVKKYEIAWQVVHLPFKNYRMTIHREGFKSIAIATLIFGALNVSMFWFFSASLMWLSVTVFFITLVLLLFIVSFFRIPDRALTIDTKSIIAPADG